MDGNFILLILFLGQWCLSVLLFAVLKNAGLNVLLSRVAYKIACLPEYFNLPVAGFLFSFLIAPYYYFIIQDTQIFGAPAYLFCLAVFTPLVISVFLLVHKKARQKLKCQSSIYYMLHFLLQHVVIYVILFYWLSYLSGMQEKHFIWKLMENIGLSVHMDSSIGGVCSRQIICLTIPL